MSAPARPTGATPATIPVERRAIPGTRRPIGPRPPIGESARGRMDRFAASVRVRRLGLLRPPSLVAIGPRAIGAAARWPPGGAAFGPRLGLTLRRIVRRRTGRSARSTPQTRSGWSWSTTASWSDPVAGTEEHAIEVAAAWPTETVIPPFWLDADPSDEPEGAPAVAGMPFARRQDGGPRPAPLDLALSRPKPASRATGTTAAPSLSGAAAAPPVLRSAEWRPTALAAIDRAPPLATRSMIRPDADPQSAIRAPILSRVSVGTRGAVPLTSGESSAGGGFAGNPAWPMSPMIRTQRPELPLHAWTGSSRAKSGRIARDVAGTIGGPVARPIGGFATSAPRPTSAEVQASQAAGYPGTGIAIPAASSLHPPPRASTGSSAVDRAADHARSSVPVPDSPSARVTSVGAPLLLAPDAGSSSEARFEDAASSATANAPSPAPVAASGTPTAAGTRSSESRAAPFDAVRAAAFDPVRAAGFGPALPILSRWLASIPSPAVVGTLSTVGASASPWGWPAPTSTHGWTPLGIPLVRRHRALDRLAGPVPPGFGFARPSVSAGAGWPGPSFSAPMPALVPASPPRPASGVPAEVDRPIGTGAAISPARSWTPVGPIPPHAAGGAAWRLLTDRAAGQGQTARTTAGDLSGVMPPPEAHRSVSAERQEPWATWPGGGQAAASRFWLAPNLALRSGAIPGARARAGMTATPLQDRWGATFASAGAGRSLVERVPETDALRFGIPMSVTRSARTVPESPVRDPWRGVDAILAAHPTPTGAQLPAAESLFAQTQAVQRSGTAPAALAARLAEVAESDRPALHSRPIGPVVAGAGGGPGAPAAAAILRRSPADRWRKAERVLPSGARAAGGLRPSASAPAAAATGGAWPAGKWALPPSRVLPTLARTRRAGASMHSAGPVLLGASGPPGGAATDAFGPAPPMGADVPGWAFYGGAPASASFAGSSEWPAFAGAPPWRRGIGRQEMTAGSASVDIPRRSRAVGPAPTVLTLFRSALPSAPEPTPARVAGVAASLAGSVGQPLPRVFRRTMEGVMGVDLGRVRVHSGPRVARAAEAVGARAMTLGSDIFLPGGVEDSPRPANLPLVAHELAHAVGHRQGGDGAASAPWVRLARKEAPEEQQASRLEAVFAGGAGAQSSRPGAEPMSLPLARTPTPQASGGPALASAPSASAWPVTEVQVQRQADLSPTLSDGSGIYAGGLGGAATTTGAAARIQRAEGDAAPASSASEGAKPTDENALAERVFKLLQRRLIVERERVGAVGRFGRFV